MLYYILEVAKGSWKTYGATDPEMHNPRTAAAQVEFHHPHPVLPQLGSTASSAKYSFEISQGPSGNSVTCQKGAVWYYG